MILSTGGWPDRSHLSYTGGDTEVAEHAENKAVKESHWTTRWQHDRERAGKSDPGAVEREKVVGILAFIASRFILLENGERHADHREFREFLLEVPFNSTVLYLGCLHMLEVAFFFAHFERCQN